MVVFFFGTFVCPFALGVRNILFSLSFFYPRLSVFESININILIVLQYVISVCPYEFSQLLKFNIIQLYELNYFLIDFFD